MTDDGKRCRGSLRQRYAGFSLLELLLVLFIMGLMTTTAMLMTGGVEDQSKYDETKRRMELIKRAIVGDPTRTVNGGPEISGFVADMGRLPGCLRELIEPKHCNATDYSADELWGQDATTKLWGGWRGPYISVIADSDGTSRFRDGWQNIDSDAAEYAKNYGWNWDGTDPNEPILQSLGASIADAGDDYPQPVSGVGVSKLVVEDDYLVSDTLTIIFANESATSAVSVVPATTTALKAQFEFMIDGAVSSALADITPPVSSVPDNYGTLPVTVDVPAGAQKIGVKRLLVICSGGADDGKNYNGQCVSSAVPQFLVMPPRTQLHSIRWSVSP